MAVFIESAEGGSDAGSSEVHLFLGPYQVLERASVPEAKGEGAVFFLGTGH